MEFVRPEGATLASRLGFVSAELCALGIFTVCWALLLMRLSQRREGIAKFCGVLPIVAASCCLIAGGRVEHLVTPIMVILGGGIALSR
jgi:hypothetical protein